jgi:secreted trypsin-like serine protease
MRFLILLLAAAFCEARPNYSAAHPALMEIGQGSYILGGVEAGQGEFPHQLSQDRLGASWSHSCGASLLAAQRGLSAAHCVQGAGVNILRVIGGLHYRNDHSTAQISNLNSYAIHEQYNQGAETFNNDIAILHLATPINANNINGVGAIRFATLPSDNSNQYAEDLVWISGWGRNGAPNTLPNELRKVQIRVLTQIECNTRMAPVNGALTGPGQICVYDNNQTAGSCNGDSGGPMNHGDANSWTVIGVTSWGIQGGGVCLPSYPSAYTRTSYFLAWIGSH